jgi:UDP-glucose 4-epimerase
MRATALVTGGGGYIGSHCVAALVDSGVRCIVVDNLSNCFGGVAESLLRLLPSRSVRFVQADIRDRACLSRIFAAESIDVVLHFAGLKSVPESFESPERYFEINVGGSASLMASAVMAGIKKFIFSSSAAVYRPSTDEPLMEQSQVEPASPYGWTKALAERLFCSAIADTTSIALRYFNPVGAHDSGLLGEYPRANLGNVMPSLCVAAESGRPFRVCGVDFPTADGSAVRDFVHVMDVADAHVAATHYLLEGGATDVFNIGRGVGTSVLQLHGVFCEVNSLHVPVEVTERRPGDVPCVFAAVDKAGQILGWSAKRGLREMCAEAWSWWGRRRSCYAEIWVYDDWCGSRLTAAG